MKEIELKELAATVRRLAEEKPRQRAYCYYEREGRPCCIVGHALYSHGVDIDTLRKWRATGIHQVIHERGKLRGYSFTLDTEPDGTSSLDYIEFMQRAQDEGWQWGKAQAAWDSGQRDHRFEREEFEV